MFDLIKYNFVLILQKWLKDKTVNLRNQMLKSSIKFSVLSTNTSGL